MKKNKTTKVLFLLEYDPSGVLAVFPEVKEGRSKVKCYSHIGQHATAAIDYYGKLQQAPRREYKALYDELTANGYNLEVLNDDLYEPIKRAITSPETEGQTIIVYKDGGIKIIQQHDHDNGATVTYLLSETVQEILQALKAP